MSVSQPAALADQIVERLAIVLEERYHWERYRWRIPRAKRARKIATTDARAALNTLGLDRKTLEMIADWRYSDEFVGNVLRSRFLG